MQSGAKNLEGYPLFVWEGILGMENLEGSAFSCESFVPGVGEEGKG